MKGQFILVPVNNANCFGCYFFDNDLECPENRNCGSDVEGYFAVYQKFTGTLIPHDDKIDEECMKCIKCNVNSECP